MPKKKKIKFDDGTLQISGPIKVRVYGYGPYTCEIYDNNTRVGIIEKDHFIYESYTINPSLKRNRIRIVVTSGVVNAIRYKIIIGKKAIYRSEVFDLSAQGLHITEFTYTAGELSFGDDRRTTDPAAVEFKDTTAYEPLQPLELKQHFDNYESLNETSVAVPVYYATNREAVYSDGTLKAFADKDGDELSFGVGMVSIPLNRRRGESSRPKWWKCEFRENQDKHIMILSMNGLNETDFFDAVKNEIKGSKSQDVLVFIHGYNESFASSIRRAAQISFDIDFKGVTSAFSWPSANSWHAYLADRDTYDIILDDLCLFLNKLSESAAGGKVYLLAHSMGNEAMTRSLIKLAEEKFFDKKTFNQVIMAAPDVDERLFVKTFAKKALGHLKQVTLYASKRDIAIWFSQMIRLNRKRMGRFSTRLKEIERLDVVNASKQCTDLLGHGYFSQTKPMIKDIRRIIKNGFPPEKRKLEPRLKRGKQYWEFKKNEN